MGGPAAPAAQVLEVVVGDDVVRQYREGVEAVVSTTARFDDGAWDETACGGWSATMTARHLLAVATWYHGWLDRAVDGDASPPFSRKQLAVQNEIALNPLAGLDGPAAIERFRDEADRYLDRADGHRDLPFGYPAGTVTVGLHLGVAATEWHIHAWDLSTVRGPLHEPTDPAGLFVVAGRCVAETEPPLRRAALRRLVPLGARRSPWPSLLRRSGRTPRPG